MRKTFTTALAVLLACLVAATPVSAIIKTDAIIARHITANTITADKLSVTTLSAISANLGTVTAGTINGLTITGGAVTLDSSGITITAGTGDSNKIKWSDGPTIFSSGDVMSLNSFDGTLVFNGGSAGLELGSGALSVINGSPDLGVDSGGGRFGDLFLNGTAKLVGLAGSGNRAVCANSAGVLVIC
jgi:hypothetical protein